TARTGGGGGPNFLGLGLRFAQNAPKDGAGLRSVRGQGSAFLRFRGGEFSTGTMGNFQPVLTFRLFAAPATPGKARHDRKPLALDHRRTYSHHAGKACWPWLLCGIRTPRQKLVRDSRGSPISPGSNGAPRARITRIPKREGH